MKSRLLVSVSLCLACNGANIRGLGFNPSSRELLNAAAIDSGDIAVFDADGTIWAGDVGAAFFLWQLETGRLLQREAAGAAELWQRHEAQSVEERDVWIGVTTALAGLPEDSIVEWAGAFFEEHFADSVFRPMRDLIEEFRRREVEVWIVSASHRWIVEAGARVVGIPAERVIAVATEVRDGAITDRVVEPVPYGVGKAQAIRQQLRGRVVIAFGNSLSDAPMLETASSAIVINPNGALEALARERGWGVERF